MTENCGVDCENPKYMTKRPQCGTKYHVGRVRQRLASIRSKIKQLVKNNFSEES